jgi:putative sterol carrier protein
MSPESNEVTDEDGDAACTITTDMETFKGMYDKSVSPQAAFMTGKIKIAGDMGIALKLQSVIG